MARLFRWAGDGLPANAALLPGQSGAGDPPLSRGMITGGGLGAKMSVTQPGSRPRVGFDNWILFEDWAIDGRNRLEFKFDEAPHMHHPVPPEALPLTRYSMRFYFRMGADPEVWGMGPYRLFSFADGHEGYAWSYYLSDGTLHVGLISLYKPTIATGYDSAPRVTTPDAYDDWQIGDPLPGQGKQDRFQVGLGWWRCEVQVDAARDPKVVARLYRVDHNNHVDSTTPDPDKTLTANPTTVAADRVYFGDDRTTGYQPHTYMAQLEVHDTYDLGGEFSSNPEPPEAASTTAVGAPVRRKVWRFAKHNGPGQAPTVLAAGRWDGEDVRPLRGVGFRWRRDVHFTGWEGYGWFLPNDMPGDTDTSITWGDLSNQWKKMSLYWPTGDPPPDGWPLVVWAHGGFFVEGSYRQMRPEWVRNWTRAGFAVASTSYRLGDALALNPPYPTYQQGAGQFPSFLVDYKNAVNWLAAHGAGGTGDYPVDGSRVIFAGFSAGGYIALASAVSAGLTDDGYGRDLTAEGNDGVFGESLGPDPVPLGAICCGGPVDMTIAVEHDLTVGFDPIGDGIMLAAAKPFVGRAQYQSIPAGSLEATGVTNLIARQAAAGGPVPPVLYVRGTSDHLVVEEHEGALAAAMAEHAPGVPYQRVDAVNVPHDLLERYLPYGRIIGWARERVD